MVKPDGNRNHVADRAVPDFHLGYAIFSLGLVFGIEYADPTPTTHQLAFRRLGFSLGGMPRDGKGRCG